MKTINSSELLNILRDSVAMKNVQEPMIVVTNNPLTRKRRLFNIQFQSGADIYQRKNRVGGKH